MEGETSDVDSQTYTGVASCASQRYVGAMGDRMGDCSGAAVEASTAAVIDLYVSALRAVKAVDGGR